MKMKKSKTWTTPTDTYDKYRVSPHHPKDSKSVASQASVNAAKTSQNLSPPLQIRTRSWKLIKAIFHTILINKIVWNLTKIVVSLAKLANSLFYQRSKHKQILTLKK